MYDESNPFDCTQMLMGYRYTIIGGIKERSGEPGLSGVICPLTISQDLKPPKNIKKNHYYYFNLSGIFVTNHALTTKQK